MTTQYKITSYKIIGYERLHNAKPKNMLELYINYNYKYTNHIFDKEATTCTFLIFDFDEKEDLYKLNSELNSGELILFLANNNMLTTKGYNKYYLNKSILLELI